MTAPLSCQPLGLTTTTKGEIEVYTPTFQDGTLMHFASSANSVILILKLFNLTNIHQARNHSYSIVSTILFILEQDFSLYISNTGCHQNAQYMII